MVQDFNLQDFNVRSKRIPFRQVRKIRLRQKRPTSCPKGEDSRIAHLWIGQYDADGHWIFNQDFSEITGGKVDVRLKDSGERTVSGEYIRADKSDL